MINSHHSRMESSLRNERKILYEEREGNIKKMCEDWETCCLFFICIYFCLTSFLES
jgi:hypothetical protein